MFKSYTSEPTLTMGETLYPPTHPPTHSHRRGHSSPPPLPPPAHTLQGRPLHHPPPPSPTAGERLCSDNQCSVDQMCEGAMYTSNSTAPVVDLLAGATPPTPPTITLVTYSTALQVQ